MRATVFRLYVVFIALTAPLLLVFAHMYDPDSYWGDLVEVYRRVIPAFKKGSRL